MRIFFDVDLTILGQDGSLRPGTRELFVRLIDEGHEVYVWSGFGERWDDLRRHDLDGIVHGVFNKPLSRQAEGHEVWGLPFAPDFVVDDHPGLPTYLPGINVTAYVDRRFSAEDTEMDRVYRAIVEADRLNPGR
ncbi:MAG: hypothetical protein ACHQDE_01165 [Acidimicrobiia bacterium]